MIRVTLENGQVALFTDDEEVSVCRDVIDGEYIVDERYCEAIQLLFRFDDKNDDFPFIFLDAEKLADGSAAGIGAGPYDIYRIAKVDQLPNVPPSFLK